MSRQTSGGKTEDKDTRVDRNSLCNESSGAVVNSYQRHTPVPIKLDIVNRKTSNQIKVRSTTAVAAVFQKNSNTEASDLLEKSGSVDTTKDIAWSSNANNKELAAIRIQRWFRDKSKSQRLPTYGSKLLQQPNIQDIKLLLQEKKKNLNQNKKTLNKENVHSHHQRRMSGKQAVNLTGHKTTVSKKSANSERKMTPLLEAKKEIKHCSHTKKRNAQCKEQVSTSDQSAPLVPSPTQGNLQKTSSPIVQKEFSAANVVSAYEEILETLHLQEGAPSVFSQTPCLNEGGNETSSELHENKLQSIIAYLDEVEKMEVGRTKDFAKYHVMERGSETSSTVYQSPMEAASATVNDVTTTVLAQRLELENKNETICMLQKALSQQRELTIYHTKEMEKEGKKRLTLQKSELEATIKRHQCFIDQLIEDKKILQERCENLLKELKEKDKKFTLKINAMEDSHATEVHKIKQVSFAAERLRKEKWQAEESRRIKESTVKGLEPEIQKIIAKGKAELHKLKALHQAELAQADERAGRKVFSQLEELRNQYELDKDQACLHEREISRQRYEELVKKEEVNFQQQRRRLFTEAAHEKQKLAGELHQQKTLFDSQLKKNNEEHQRLLEEIKSKHALQLKDILLGHNLEVQELQKQFEDTCKTLEQDKQSRWNSDKKIIERDLKNRLRDERDKEIELIISKLEEELMLARKDIEDKAESKVRWIEEKGTSELKEAEQSEKNAISKYHTLKTQNIELQGELNVLKSMLRQQVLQLKEVTEVATKLTEERDRMSEVVRQEFIDRISMMDQEKKHLLEEVSELQSKHQVELDYIRRKHEQKMEDVHGKVKLALEKKEENLMIVKGQYESALKRVDHLQLLLQRQRTELINKT